MCSIDCKVYLCFVILEGFEKSRNVRILIFIDVNWVWDLLKYDWVEKLVDIILVLYCIFIKKGLIKDDEEILEIDEFYLILMIGS